MFAPIGTGKGIQEVGYVRPGNIIANNLERAAEVSGIKINGSGASTFAPRFEESVNQSVNLGLGGNPHVGSTPTFGTIRHCRFV